MPTTSTGLGSSQRWEPRIRSEAAELRWIKRCWGFKNIFLKNRKDTEATPEVVIESPIGELSDVKFQGPGVAVTSDAILSCFLIPAMNARKEIVLPTAPSAKLRANLPHLMQTLASWNSGLSAVDVQWASKGQPFARGNEKARGVGCFFSGGVDSFFTLVQRKREISHLILVQGFDIPESRPDLWARTCTMIGDVAASFEKREVVLKTDIRLLLDPVAGWGLTHGAAIATTAHLLAGQIPRAIVPSSYTRAQLHPWGTHPELDPLWSGDAVDVEHDTVEVSRVQKVEAIAGDASAMKWLRVCWHNRDQEYNCGKCPKCMRTRIALAIVGARCETMPPDISATEIRSYDASDPVERFFAEELHEAAAGDVRSALEDVLNKSPTPSAPPPAAGIEKETGDR